MNQTRSPSPADLQLRQNFRWVLLSPPLDPVAGLLGRYLRRGLTHLAGETQRVNDLQKIIDWLTTVWQYTNKFTTSVSSTSQSNCIGLEQICFLNFISDMFISDILLTISTAGCCGTPLHLYIWSCNFGQNDKSILSSVYRKKKWYYNFALLNYNQLLLFAQNSLDYCVIKNCGIW